MQNIMFSEELNKTSFQEEVTDDENDFKLIKNPYSGEIVVTRSSFEPRQQPVISIKGFYDKKIAEVK